MCFGNNEYFVQATASCVVCLASGKRHGIALVRTAILRYFEREVMLLNGGDYGGVVDTGIWTLLYWFLGF